MIMFGSFLPSVLGWFGNHQSLLGSRSRHCHGINSAHGAGNQGCESFARTPPQTNRNARLVDRSHTAPDHTAHPHQVKKTPKLSFHKVMRKNASSTSRAIPK